MSFLMGRIELISIILIELAFADRIYATEFTLNLRNSRIYATAESTLTAESTRQQNLCDSRIYVTAESIQQQNLTTAEYIQQHNLYNSRIYTTAEFYVTKFTQQNQRI